MIDNPTPGMVVYGEVSTDWDCVPEDWKELDTAHILVQDTKGQLLAIELRGVSRYGNGALAWRSFEASSFYPTQLDALDAYIKYEIEYIDDLKGMVVKLKVLAEAMRRSLERLGG